MPIQMVRRALFTTAIISTLLAPNHLLAQTVSAQLSISATVESGCSLTGGTLDFGTYVSGQTADLDVAGTISYANCGPATLNFELDDGLQPSSGDRQMASDDDELNYELYRNTTRTAVWGDGSSSQEVRLFATQNGTVDVYGRIPGGQTAPAGTYTDMVTITLTF